VKVSGTEYTYIYTLLTPKLDGGVLSVLLWYIYFPSSRGKCLWTHWIWCWV